MSKISRAVESNRWQSIAAGFRMSIAAVIMMSAVVAQGAMNVVTNQLGEIGNDEYVVTSITGAAIETNEVNALILAYDMTNLTVRFNGKLDLPPMLAPTNWIPVSIGNGRAEWMPNIGGGGSSLGSVNYITDSDGKCYPVYATTNSEGKVIQVVGQIPIAPMKKTVEQEEFRAVTAETLLYTNALAETAQRIATDNMLLDKINAISALGRLISTWDCEAGRPTTEPLTEEITYKSGDYYLVGKVATNATNFIPNGTVYHRGQQSTTPALDDVYVNDVYRHTEDGSWVHTVMAGVMVRWEQIDGNPTNNQHFVEAVNDLSFVVVTQTVDKAYVESLGIDVGISTAAVERIVVQYDATNLSSRIDARVEKPDESVPAGYSLVKGVTNLTEWAMLPGTNIVGYLCYIRDAESNAYRVVAMKNPNNEIVAAVEQTPTPMEIITIEEERLARIAGDLAGTNYTDSATNALSLALVPRIVEAAKKGTNYTDSATNAVTSWVKGTFLPLAGGTMAGDINMDYNGINITDNAKITFDNAGESLMFKSLSWYSFSNIDATKISALLPDGTPVLTAKKAETDYPAITNAYAYTDAATNRVAGMISDEAALRASGDTALATSIASEAAARESGDDDLDTKIAVEKERAETKETLLNVAITNEAEVRASADAVLQTNIGIETTRATVNETALGRRIDALVDGTNTVAEMVRTEKTRAETAEAGLIPKSEKGVSNGVATLDGTGKVPVAQIPTIAVEWGNIGGTLDNQTDLTNRLATKQDKLPEVVKDYYLHANFLDGHLEWKGIEGGDISNYNALAYKPIINGNVLTGGINLVSHQLGLQSNLVYTTADNGKVLGVVNTNLMWVTGGGGGVDTNTVQYIIDDNIATNHIVGYELFEMAYNDLSDEVGYLDHTKRDYYDFHVNAHFLDDYLPIRKDGKRIPTNEIVVQWETYGYRAYCYTGEFIGTYICKSDSEGKLTELETGITMGSSSSRPALGTKVIEPADNILLESQAGGGGTWGSIGGSITNQVDLYTILTNKRDLTDRQWIHDITTPWTSTSSSPAIDAILNDRAEYPDGAWRWVSGQNWTCDYGTKPTDEFLLEACTGGDRNQTYIEFIFRKRATTDTFFGTATRSFTKGENFVIETELEKGLRQKRDVYDVYIPGKLINGCLPVSINGTEVDNADLTYEKYYDDYIVYAYRGTSNEKEVCRTDASGDLTVLGSNVLLGGYTPSIGDHVLMVEDFLVDGSYANANLQTQLVHTAAENGKVLGVTNNTIAWVTQTGGGGSVTNAAYREKIDYAYYAEDYYDLEPLKTALGIDYAYLVLADEKFRKQSTSTHWRWYMYNADFEMIGRSQEYSSPENAHASIINIECALGWAFLYKKAIPGNGIKTNRRIITEYEAGIEGGYQTNLIVSASDNGKVLGIANNKLSWVEGGSGGPTDTLILNGDEDIITGPYVIPHGYGEEGQMLVSKGTNAPPEWSDQPIMVLNGTITNAIGPVVIPGGYGQKGQILVGNNNSSPTWLSSGTIGSILVSNGSVANPSWKGTETLTFTKSSYVSGGTIKASKFGNVVVINFENIKVSSTSAGMLLGNLSGSFPSSQRACQVCKTSGNIGLVTVESDGRVQAWNMLTDGGYWGSITYIID